MDKQFVKLLVVRNLHLNFDTNKREYEFLYEELYNINAIISFSTKTTIEYDDCLFILVYLRGDGGNTPYSYFIKLETYNKLLNDYTL